MPLILEEPPVLRVPAGPGTGKTFGLRKRVLRLLHPGGGGVAAERVLVCAFNRAIAEDLRRELAAELTPFGLSLPRIQTVHGLASTITNRHPRYLLPHEVETMVYDLLENHETLAAQFENKHREAMRALREHEAGMDDFTALKQAATGWLADHGAALVGDLPRTAERGLTAGDFPEPRFDHVIVDEFQDLTVTEAKLALALRAPGARVVALGDRKQSIYAFRGNDERGLESLPELVGGPVVDHRMTECRRCHSEVVKLANAIMALQDEPLEDVRGPGGQIHQVHYETPEDEHRGLAEQIIRAWQAKPDGRHLVLTSRREWGYNLRTQISEIAPDIDAQTVFAEDILETWPAREAFIFLSILANPADPATLRDWVGYKTPDEDGRGWKAPRRNAPAYEHLRGEGLLTVERLRAIADQPVGALSGTGRSHVHERARRLRGLLDEPEGIDRQPEEIVGWVLDDPKRWVQENAASAELARQDLNRLKTEAQRMLNETEPALGLNDLVGSLRSRIATREPIGQSADPQIEIVTLWGAKGLTADYVYVAGLCDEALPGPHDQNSTGLTESEHLMEQLRLLYVSVTRARSGLVISRPTRIKRGEVKALGLTHGRGPNRWWQDLHACSFLRDLPAGVLPDSVPGADWVDSTSSR